MVKVVQGSGVGDSDGEDKGVCVMPGVTVQ